MKDENKAQPDERAADSRLMHDAMEDALWGSNRQAAPEDAFKLGWQARAATRQATTALTDENAAALNHYIKSELKPCPMCGGQATLVFPFKTLDGKSTFPRCNVECQWCGVKARSTEASEKAISAWNCRAS